MSKIVDRTLDLLELFASEKRPLPLSEIAQLLAIPVSSCYDVVQAMQARGFIYEIAPRSGYYPTLRLRYLAEEIGSSDPFLLRAERLLSGLRDSLEESVLLAKATGIDAKYLLVFDPTEPLRILVKVGDSVRSIYATSAGKAVLGSLDRQTLISTLETINLSKRTTKTITSMSALRKDIALSQKRGWYTNCEESLVGVTTVSVSLSWNSSVYILTVAGPTFRMDQKIERVIKSLVAASRQLQLQNGSDFVPRAQKFSALAQNHQRSGGGHYDKRSDQI